MPRLAPANTSHQWCRWSVIRDIEHKHAYRKKTAWIVGMSIVLRNFGVRICKYLNEEKKKKFTWTKMRSRKKHCKLPYHENRLEKWYRWMSRWEWFRCIPYERATINGIRAFPIGYVLPEQNNKNVRKQFRKRWFSNANTFNEWTLIICLPSSTRLPCIWTTRIQKVWTQLTE